MEVLLLGSSSVQGSHGAALDLGGPKQRAVLAMLALGAGRPISVDRLVEGVWGEWPPPRASRTLSVYISTLRSVLDRDDPGSGGRILKVPPGYQLNTGRAEVDVLRFEDLTRTGRDALAAGRPHEARDVLRAALAMFRGLALADLQSVPFAAVETERIERERQAALEDRIEADLAGGEHAVLVTELQDLVQQFPLTERLWAQLMLALYRSGRQAEALAAFGEVRGILLEEYGVEPGPALVELQTQILRQDPRLLPRVPRTRLAALPVPLTDLLGRSTLVDQVQGLLSRLRLVTLSGPGGVGKTRVAIEVAHLMSKGLETETVFVGLAETSDTLAAVAIFAAALDVEIDPGADARAALLAGAAARELLLVADNLEQLPEVGGLLGQLLNAAPGLRVLATSRHRLRVPGELVVPIAPLELPDPSSSAQADLEDQPALHLLVQRARDVYPHYQPAAAELSELALLCHDLDGLPLALELAAPKLRTMSPAELRRGLRGARVTLTGPGAGQPRHQASLESTVDWSLDLLTPAARAAFCRLSVFSGGFTLDAAAHVCGALDDERGSGAALDWLDELVDASLVQVVESPVGRRFLLLQTLRARAQRLVEDVPALCRRHAEYFATLAAELNTAYDTANSLHVHNRFRDDDDNLSAALAWATTEAPPIAVRLAINWRLLAATVRRYDELRQSLEWLVDGELDDVDGARCRVLLGGLNYQQGRSAAALPLLNKSVPALSTAAPTEDLTVRGWCWLAVSRLTAGDPGGATEAADEALRLGRQAGRSYLESTTLDLSSFVAQRTGRTLDARTYIEEGLALDRLRGDRLAVLHSTIQLAEVLTQVGETTLALESVEEVLAAANRGEASEWLQLSALRVRGRALLLAGDTGGAVMCLRETVVRWDAAGAANEAHEELLALAALRRSQGDSGSAARILGMAETYRDAHQLSDGEAVPYVAESLERLPVDLGAHQYRAEVHRGQGVDPAGVVEAALRELPPSSHNDRPVPIDRVHGSAI